MEYIVKEVISQKPAQYGKTNYRVRFEGDEKVVGMFSQYPIEVGKKVNGEIVQNDKWFNFKFVAPEKKDQTPTTDARAANILDFKVLPMLIQMNGRIEMMMKHMDLEPDTEYPEMNSTNDGSPF